MDYYEIKEEFMNIRILSGMMDQLREIMDRYPNTRSMTLEEAWRFMNDRSADLRSALHKSIDAMNNQVDSNTLFNFYKSNES